MCDSDSLRADNELANRVAAIKPAVARERHRIARSGKMKAGRRRRQLNVGPLGVNGADVMIPRGRGYFRLVTIRDVPVFVHWSLPIGGIVISVYAGFDFDGAAYYALGYVCLVALHELAHALSARAYGLKVLSIEISGVGGLCQIERPKKLPHSFVIFSAGVIGQAIVLGGAIAYQAVFGVPESRLERCLLRTFTVANAVMIFLNLLPLTNSNGLASDGLVLWRLVRHCLWGHPHPHPPIEIVPNDQSRLFPPETTLLSITELVPPGFNQGVEIFNDRTTPMNFVMQTLMRNLKVTEDEAIQWTVKIHNEGGLLVRLPTLQGAEDAAKAITEESIIAGHKLVCRAVHAQQNAPAESTAPAASPLA